MDDLLKEAIADAKAVRETALQNAKMALEEAFTPRLKSMLSKKIQSEDGYDMEEDDEMEDEEEMEVEPEVEPEEIPEEEGEEEAEAEAEAEAELEDEEDAEEEMEEEGVIEIDGVKYAPVVSEEGEEEEAEEEAPEDEEDMGDDLDLEAVLRELESELEEDEDADFTEESEIDESESVEEAEEADEDDEDKEDVDEEVDKSSGIGKSDNHKGESDESSKIGVPGKAKLKESEEFEEVIAESDELTEAEEEIDLEEVLRALQEEDEVDTTSEDMENLQTELDEHRDVVKYLRSKLNEVNLLNAKLLFTNKLFRSYGLSNDQKMKVVETFDRAKNLREVKLVYATMAESFVKGSTREEIVKESKKGSASRPVASTKSEKQEQEILSESDEMKQRFQKLANIL